MAGVLGVAEIRQAIRERSLDPDAAIAESWERARAAESRLHAFAHLPEAPPVSGSGPLAGVAVGVKDLMDTADMPTAYGTTVLAGHRPGADAAIVGRLRRLGATVLGKTVTTEFAYRHPGPTRNPWNPDHTPGGSSSGSAASVGAGIVPLALGTQTLGSVIRPAAYCGVIGFKPTFGLLPREGIHPLCSALDTVGLFARSVGDIQDVLGLLVPRSRDASAATERPLRIGVLAPDEATTEPAQRAALETVATAFRDAGHVVDPFLLPSGLEDTWEVVGPLLAGEAVRHFGAIVDAHGTRVSAPIRDLVERGRVTSHADYERARSRQAELAERHATEAGGFDVILTVPAPGEAPHGLDSTGDPRYCVPWSLLGVPAVTFPVALGAHGLPVGVQLVAHRGRDDLLLRCAAAVAPPPPGG